MRPTKLVMGTINKFICGPGACESNTLVAFDYGVERLVEGLIASHAAASWQCRSACLGFGSAHVYIG